MRIGEILVRQGLVSPADLEAAVLRKRLYGQQLGANLVALQRLTAQQLAAVLQDQRELAGLSACEKKLAECERTFGPDHLNTSQARYKLARLRLLAGDVDAALTLGEAALAVQAAALGAEHPWTRATTQLVDSARAQQDLSEPTAPVAPRPQ